MYLDDLREIRREYERTQRKNAAIYEEKIRKLHEEIPRLKEIDKTLKLLGLKLAKEVFLHPEKEDKITESYWRKVEKLDEEKEALLSLHHYDSSAFEKNYDCSICRDTGYVDSKNKCSCYRQKLVDRRYNLSNLSHQLNKENFNTFDIDLFSSRPDEEYGISPRDNLLSHQAIAQGFVFDFEKAETKSLLLHGPTGTGKTFLINCIAKALLDREFVVVYQTAPQMIHNMEEVHFNSKKNHSELQVLFDSDLLVIDDLGTELTNSFTNGELFNILNSRMLHNKKTVISTNLEIHEMALRYDDRIMSRIIHTFELLSFFGDDLRFAK